MDFRAISLEFFKTAAIDRSAISPSDIFIHLGKCQTCTQKIILKLGYNAVRRHYSISTRFSEFPLKLVSQQDPHLTMWLILHSVLLQSHWRPRNNLVIFLIKKVF